MTAGMLNFTVLLIATLKVHKILDIFHNIFAYVVFKKTDDEKVPKTSKNASYTK